MTQSGRPQMFDDLLIVALKGLNDEWISEYLLLTFAKSLLQSLLIVEGSHIIYAVHVEGK